MGLTRVNLFLEAVRTSTAFYADRGDIPGTLGQLAEAVETLDQFDAWITPALDAYAETLPAALVALYGDRPSDEED